MMKGISVLLVFVSILIEFSISKECTPLSFQHLCMKDQGATVILENEKLSLTINKAKASITALHYNSHKEPKKHTINLLQSGSGYYLGSISVAGKGSQAGPYNCHLEISENSESRIDLAFRQKEPKSWPIEFELHLALEKGSSMFYYYSVHRYTKDMPSGYTAGELRWALRTNEQVFKYYNIDGKRAGAFPANKLLKEGSTVQDWTYKLKDGSVYSKYQHISGDEDVSSVFGIFDDHLGLSLIQPNKEWGRGGPFKQDLTTHSGGGSGGPMMLFHEHTGHYGTPALEPTHGWTKVYGPVAFYLNEGDTPDAMYKDAQRQLKAEEAKWPYKWVSAKEYMANSRGSIWGTLKVADGTKPEWAYLILTEPHVEDPQYESATYMYAAKAGPDGKFWIPGVRPGTYKLQIIAKGVVGKYIQNGVKVQSNHSLDMKTINWVPEAHGHTLWQIGVPDRTSAEFHMPSGYPSPVPHVQEYRKFGTWLTYSKEYPHDVDFTIGKSDPAKHWCYFMPMIKTPGYVDQLKMVNITQNTYPTNWKVRFNYKGTNKGNATLTMGFAAAVRGGMKAAMNGHEVFKVEWFDGPKGDSALFRQAAHGIFRQYHGTFSSTILKQGENVLEFTPPGPVSANHFDRMVMWDFLRLEAQG